MKINGDMLTLAREFQGLTQKELAVSVGVSQSTIAKLEGRLKSDFPDESIPKLINALTFPKEFFEQNEELLTYGSSEYFYRKRNLTAAERGRIHSVVNLLRIAVRKYMRFVDIEPSRPLPRIDLEEGNGSPSTIAHAVRAQWSLPHGPVRNLTGLLESAGVLVMRCDFRSRAFDATSLRLADTPPLIFINKDLPGDRWRFSLAHELGHLVMHDIAHPKMEKQANEFAAELLTPAMEIKPQMRHIRWSIPELVKLKMYWLVSIAMLVYRGAELGALSREQARKLRIQLAPFRRIEPAAMDQEETNSFERVVNAIKDDLGFGHSGLQSLTHWPDRVTRIFLSFSSEQPVSRLKLVQ